MTTCPVCDHQQATGAECEVCGRALPPPGVFEPELEPLVEPMDGLETTAQEAGVAVADPALLAELEPTLQPGVGAVAVETFEALEPTSTGPVEAPAERVPDLEPTAAVASLDPPTELPLFPVCRYCRTPAGPGERMCARCGVRLDIAPAPPPGGTPAAPRLCSCGTPVTRSTCPACGARNQVE